MMRLTITQNSRVPRYESSMPDAILVFDDATGFVGPLIHSSISTD